MKRSMFVVVVLMAAVAVYGSDRSVQPMGFDGQHFAGPVCLPGDPCGPWPGGAGNLPTHGTATGQSFMGPVCYPGDPCGWPGVIQELSNGPVCYPGDPCGPWAGAHRVVQRDAGSVERFNGPMCMPGDPCGPGTIVAGSWINFSGPMCLPGDPCGPWPGRLQAPIAFGAEQRSGPMCLPGDPCGPWPPRLGFHDGHRLG